MIKEIPNPYSLPMDVVLPGDYFMQLVYIWKSAIKLDNPLNFLTLYDRIQQARNTAKVQCAESLYNALHQYNNTHLLFSQEQQVDLIAIRQLLSNDLLKSWPTSLQVLNTDIAFPTLTLATNYIIGVLHEFMTRGYIVLKDIFGDSILKDYGHNLTVYYQALAYFECRQDLYSTTLTLLERHRLTQCRSPLIVDGRINQKQK